MTLPYPWPGLHPSVAAIVTQILATPGLRASELHHRADTLAALAQTGRSASYDDPLLAGARLLRELAGCPAFTRPFATPSVAERQIAIGASIERHVYEPSEARFVVLRDMTPGLAQLATLEAARTFATAAADGEPGRFFHVLEAHATYRVRARWPEPVDGDPL